jgi:ABC-type molybdate transport system substrate-binding protein
MPTAELRILAGGGIADPLDEIVARFERAHGQSIVTRHGTL